MRVMYDSITASDIPAAARMVAGYVDGTWAWSAGDWARFPNATKVRITVAGSLDADAADVETGDLTPTDGGAWAARMLAAGRFPVLYFSLASWGAVGPALQAAIGNTGRAGAWVADWDGITDLQVGWFAHQYQHPPASGGHFDLSVVGDYWPGVDPAPAPPPPPPAPEPYRIWAFHTTPDDVLRPLAGASQFSDALATARAYIQAHPGSTVDICTEES